MKQYTADKHAQYTLQIATPIVTAVLIGLVWYFLAVLPHWLLWTLTAVLAAAAISLTTTGTKGVSAAKAASPSFSRQSPCWTAESGWGSR